MSTFLRAFFGGWFLAIKHPFLILIRWLLNVAMALIFVAPLARLLSRDLDRSLYGAAQMTHLDYQYLLSFMDRFSGQLGTLKIWFLPAMVVFALLNLFFSGGIYAAIQRPKSSAPRAFFSACAGNFAGLLITLGWCLLLFLLLVALPLKALDMMDAELTGRINEWWRNLFYWALLVPVLLFLATYVLRVYDYARLLACRPQEEAGPFNRAFLSFFKAAGFCWRHHSGTLALWFVFLLVHGLLFFVFNWIKPLLPAGTDGWWFQVLAGQLLIAARMTTSLASMGGALTYLKLQTPSGHEAADATMTLGREAKPLEPTHPPAFVGTANEVREPLASPDPFSADKTS